MSEIDRGVQSVFLRVVKEETLQAEGFGKLDPNTAKMRRDRPPDRAQSMPKGFFRFLRTTLFRNEVSCERRNGESLQAIQEATWRES